MHHSTVTETPKEEDLAPNLKLVTLVKELITEFNFTHISNSHPAAVENNRIFFLVKPCTDFLSLAHAFHFDEKSRYSAFLKMRP